MKYVLCFVMFDSIAMFAVSLLSAACNLVHAAPAMLAATVFAIIGYLCAWKIEKIEEAEL